MWGSLSQCTPPLSPLPPLPRLQPKPEASKAGFTQQSSSRENGCCFQVLFAHLSGVDCSGENGVRGMQGFFFNIVLFQPACVGDACVFFFAVLLLLFFLQPNVDVQKAFDWIFSEVFTGKDLRFLHKVLFDLL